MIALAANIAYSSVKKMRKAAPVIEATGRATARPWQKFARKKKLLRDPS